MSKEYSFLDYLSLGNQLVQTSRLSEMRDAQTALVTLEAERLKSEKLKADIQAQEDNIREFVFGASKLLHRLESNFAQSTPVGTLAVSYGLLRHIKDLGISTARVRSYEDKEKVHEFLEHVKRVVEECEARLDAKSIQDAATCAKYKAQENALTVLVDYEQKQLEFKKRLDELANLGTPGMKRNLPTLPAALMFIIGFASMMGAGALRGANQLVNPVFFIAGIVLLLLGGWGLVHNGKNKALLLKEKLDLELQGSELEAELIADIRKDFGDGDFDYYRKLQAERSAFIKHILGNDVVVTKPRVEQP